jgi:hypothetical protein
MFFDNIYGIDPGKGLGGTSGDQEGDFPMPTNPQTPGAFGNSFNQLTQFLNNSNLAQAIPFLGLSALARNSSFFNPPPPKVGYQGGIPLYTASREQTPYVSGAQNEALRLKQAAQDAMSTGATQEQVREAAQRTYGISPSQFDQAMQAQGTYRRPGLGGITYFTPMQYTGTGKMLGGLGAGETVGGGAVTPTPGVGGTEQTGGISTLPTTPERRTAQQVTPSQQATTSKQTYSPYQVAQAIYDVLNPGGGITGTLAQARQGALNRGVSAQQFDAALMPRLSQAIREARAQMPSATDAQIRDAAMRRYGIDAATFNKAAGMAMPSDAQIKEQIRANINKPQEVAWLANTYGLDTKRLAEITGFTDSQVRSYFTDNKVALPSASAAAAAPAKGPVQAPETQVLPETVKYSDDQIRSAIQTSLQQGYDADDILDKAASMGATSDQLTRARSALVQSGYESVKPKFTDDQVSSAIRASLQQGFSAADTLARAEQLGATPEQMIRARAALRESGYAAGGFTPSGGIAMLARGRYLKGNGDGVSDSIPARFAGSGQEARLADGEFVIPARVVSELGNGSSDAGARKLYAMLDRVEARAKKAKRGKPSGADRELNKLA